jgi:hypothetical protein
VDPFAACPPPDPDVTTLTPDSVDFWVDRETLLQTMFLEDKLIPPDSCSLEEGSVRAAGLRRLLRFTTKIRNMGERDAVVGDPQDPEPPLDPWNFFLAPCRGLWRMKGYAVYELYTAEGELVGAGHKQAFCLLDSEAFVPGQPSHGYHCGYQGLSSGWTDVYGSYLDGQWVDVTGLPGGDYVLVVEVNPRRAIPEANDLRSNVACVPVSLPGPEEPVEDYEPFRVR